ncbi:MAG: hypothetical protein V3V40_06000 [Nitrosomonadaceae bacterium]
MSRSRRKNKLGILIKKRLTKTQRLACIYYYLCFIIGYSAEQARETIEAMEIYQLDEIAEQGYGSKYQNLDAFKSMVYD